ncbi:MAG: ribose-5-phosphate isomerase RpiA [Candidatus Thermoplasmatota archaeon]|nr:ribose-5-phosphate isomerase RpiA [Candidatus Thermoplasmatota archaeon]
MKRLAAEKACDYIEDGMILGLGTGSTVDYALRKIGKMVNEGIKIKGIPTSFRTKKIAIEEKIPLTSLEDNPEIDITIDGADEVDSELRLIKGGGGALTREKMIAYYSKKVIIIIDETKVVKMLGIDFSLPVEVVKFGWTLTKNKLKEFNCNVELRKIMNNPYITDNSNYIIDCEFDRIKDPEQLEKDINLIPGVVENGLFIGLADDVIVGSKQGIKTLS